MNLFFKNGKVITPMQVFKKGALAIENGIIVDVGYQEKVRKPRNSMIIDVEGNYITPGFIDMHVHGGGGSDTMEGTIEALSAIAKTHAKGGTTSLLPTTLTASYYEIERVLSCVEKVKDKIFGGAKILGIHLEGPYFSREQIGAQNPEFIKIPRKVEYLRLLNKYDCIRRVSVAPELEGGLELGQELRKRRILASIAHTNATYQDVLAAIDAGYTHVTHIYSGMSGLRRINAYRIPGVIESTLLLNELTTEIIADGHHLPPSLIRLIIKAKGLDKISLVTDAINAAGLDPGKFSLGGLDVIVEDNVAKEFEVSNHKGNYVAKLLTRDSFAGSVATMDQLVRNMVNLVGLSIQNAIKLATLNPARVLKIDAERGILFPGLKGDVVVFDENIKILITVVEGKIVYKKM